MAIPDSVFESSPFSPRTYYKIVIVLGNRLISNDLHEEPKGRMDAAIGLWSSLENCLLLVSGGRTNPSVPKTECDVMKEYAVMKGVPSDLVIKDPNALDTIGNAYFSRRILDTLPDIKFVYVVTSCYHSSRAEYIFNFCLGPNYLLDPNTCYNSGRLLEASERNSFDSARTFFFGIAPGSVVEIGKRLREQHSLYHDLVI